MIRKLIILTVFLIPIVVQAQPTPVIPYISQYMRGMLNDPNAMIARNTLELGVSNDPNFAGLNINSGGNWSIIYLDGLIGGGFTFQVNDVTTWDIYQNGDNFNFYSYVYGGSVLSVGDDGYIGIRTTAPETPLDINADSIRVRTAKTPPAANSNGKQGEITWDSDYIYVCVTTNNWKRVALSTWGTNWGFLRHPDGGYLLHPDGGKLKLD